MSIRDQVLRSLVDLDAQRASLTAKVAAAYAEGRWQPNAPGPGGDLAIFSVRRRFARIRYQRRDLTSWLARHPEAAP